MMRREKMRQRETMSQSRLSQWKKRLPQNGEIIGINLQGKEEKAQEVKLQNSPFFPPFNSLY